MNVSELEDNTIELAYSILLTQIYSITIHFQQCVAVTEINFESF